MNINHISSPLRRQIRGASIAAAILFSASLPTLRAEEIIFTIDPILSTYTLSGNDDNFGQLFEQSDGSLSTPISGHFLTSFDPLSGTPTSLSFVGGHGYYQLASPYAASPGPNNGVPEVANVAARTGASQVQIALRNVSWDFYTPAPLSGSGGVFELNTGLPMPDSNNQTWFTVLSGRQDGLSPAGFDPDNYGGTFPMTGGTWTISESPTVPGDWTLTFNGHFDYPYDVGPYEGDFVASGVVVAHAHFGASNVATVPANATDAEALGGSDTVGGVSAEFTGEVGSGEFIVQQVPNDTALSQAAVAAAEENPIFAVSTDTLSANPQMWNVDFTGDLQGNSVTLTFHYDSSQFPEGFDETTLGIWHFDVDHWDFGGVVHPETDTIDYTTSSFSPFVMGISVVPEPSSLVLAGIAIAAASMFVRRKRTA